MSQLNSQMPGYFISTGTNRDRVSAKQLDCFRFIVTRIDSEFLTTKMMPSGCRQVCRQVQVSPAHRLTSCLKVLTPKSGYFFSQLAGLCTWGNKLIHRGLFCVYFIDELDFQFVRRIFESKKRTL